MVFKGLSIHIVRFHSQRRTGGGAYSRDKNICAGTLAENGRGAYTREGACSWDTTVYISDIMYFFLLLFAVDLTLQLLEVLVLAELSLTVASSAIHPVAHSLTPHPPPLSPSNHRVLPLKREQPVRQPTSLSPLLETAPLLTLTPLTPPPPPGTQRLARLTHTPLAHHHNLKTHFVARELLE